MDWAFFLEVLVGGLLSGVMYSLVGIGFVLTYETSGVLNFAQGLMVLFGALSFVSLLERAVPFWMCLTATLALMTVLGLLIERLVLRPLLNQPPMTLFTATLGVSYIIDGVAQLAWGTEVHALDIGIDDTPLDLWGVNISSFDIAAAGIPERIRHDLRVSPVGRHLASSFQPGLELQRSRLVDEHGAGARARASRLSVHRRCRRRLMTSIAVRPRWR